MDGDDLHFYLHPLCHQMCACVSWWGAEVEQARVQFGGWIAQVESRAVLDTCFPRWFHIFACFLSYHTRIAQICDYEIAMYIFLQKCKSKYFAIIWYPNKLENCRAANLWPIMWNMILVFLGKILLQNIFLIQYSI